MRRARGAAAVILATLVHGAAARAQSSGAVGAPTPDSLAQLVMSRFAAASPDEIGRAHV